MKSSFASGLKSGFFVAIGLLSMVTSFLFFIEIFDIGGSLESGDGWATASTLVTGGVGVLVLDLAAIIWLKIYLGASDNNTVRAIAVSGSVVGFVGSALSSFGYLVLVAAENVTVDPSWSSYVTYVMAVIIVVHFALVFLSSYKSTQAKIDERMSKMLSEATEDMLSQMEDGFRANIPALAEAQSKKLTQQLATQFAGLSVFSMLEPVAEDVPELTAGDDSAPAGDEEKPVPEGNYVEVWRELFRQAAEEAAPSVNGADPKEEV